MEEKRKRKADVWDVIAALAAYFIGDMAANAITSNSMLNIIILLAIMALIIIMYTLVRYILVDKDK